MWSNSPKSYCLFLGDHTIEIQFDKKHTVEFLEHNKIISSCNYDKFRLQVEELHEYLTKYYPVK